MNFFRRKQRAFVARIDQAQVHVAIEAAEAGTTGEIVLYITHEPTLDPKVSAAAFFERLGLAALPEQNGVLIFIAPESRRFAVFGGPAYHAKTGEAHWTQLVETLGREFGDGRPTAGIVAAVAAIGVEFKRHFPGQARGLVRNVFEK